MRSHLDTIAGVLTIACGLACISLLYGRVDLGHVLGSVLGTAIGLRIWTRR